MEKYNNEIFSGKTGTEALQILLAFIMPEDAAKNAAKELIREYTSYSSVLEAPQSELAEKLGMSANAARYLHAIRESAAFLAEDKSSEMRRIFDSASAYEALKPKFMGRKREAVALMLLDERGRILYNGIVNEGGIAEVPIYIRRVVELCLMYDAYTAIIAHNHPSGNPVPSRNDINSTRDVEFALNGIDVQLEDHIIFAEGDYISLKSSEWLSAIKQEVIDYKKSVKREAREEENTLFGED